MSELQAAGAAEGVTRAESQPAVGLRMFAWLLLAAMLAFLINNFLIFWGGFPPVISVLNDAEFDRLALAPIAVYGLAVLTPIWLVMRTRSRSLRAESDLISGFNAFFIRAAFWAVLLIGLADMVISFLRVEDLLAPLVGEELTKSLGRSQFRGLAVHTPLLALSVLLASLTRTLGFTWLALLVVVAELLIVFSRFIFSYEQAFMADLVRFWYAALFLFASAYTLTKEGHVRVDVLYAGLSDKTKGYVNALGSLLLGVTLCWTVLAVGLWGKASIINSPLLSFETTQAGFGMYVKYLMAGFLGVFAVSMMLQFVAYLLESVADIRGEPGKRQISAPAAH